MGFLKDLGIIEKKRERLIINRTLQKGYKYFVIDKDECESFYSNDSKIELRLARPNKKDTS